MSAIWQFIICAILSLTAIVGGASLGAMSFAIASFRFLNLKDKDSNKEKGVDEIKQFKGQQETASH